jgi:c-di-GMP-binding flagellar brake protein YcgR
MPDSHLEGSVADLDDDERYLVHSRLEITAVLRSLIEHNALITIYFGDAGESIVTTLLAINPNFEELIFDYGADSSMNARLLQASRLSIVTQLDHIRIQFGASRAEATSFRHAPAFRIRFPNDLLRLQRREYYRVKAPLSQPVRCRVQLDPEREDSTVNIRIFDVSVGGIALVDYPPNLKPEPGTIYHNCHIDLREIGRVTTDIEIVHVMEKVSGNSVRMRLCGCRFVNMSNSMLTLIQRYINKIEREQKARSCA